MGPPPHLAELERQPLDRPDELLDELLDEPRLLEPLRTADLAPESRPAHAGWAVNPNKNRPVSRYNDHLPRDGMRRSTNRLLAMWTPLPAEMADLNLQRGRPPRHSPPLARVQNP